MNFFTLLLGERAILRWVQRVVGIRDASVVDQNINAVKKTNNPAPSTITYCTGRCGTRSNVKQNCTIFHYQKKEKNT
jgi:hypothetical protein